jgi:quinol monooxygenase YgiN
MWLEEQGKAPEPYGEARNQPEEETMKSHILMAGCAMVAIPGALAFGPAWAANPDAALAAMKSQVFSLGPNGEKAAPASSVTLTADELAKVRDRHAKAALVFHYGGNDWSNAQEAALKAQFAAKGIDVVAVTEAEDPNVFMFYENWRCKENFDAHPKASPSSRCSAASWSMEIKLYEMLSRQDF